MKKKIITIAIVAIIMNLPLLISAQTKEKDKKNETIIIEDDKTGKQSTSIEIRNGEVFIDGNKVTEGLDDKNVKIIKKKIIINGKELSDEEMENFDIPMFDKKNSNKAMLGVQTKSSENNDGAMVERVVPGSPAQKMGLQVGDIITRVNDKNIQNPQDLVEAITKHKPGETIDVTYERNNQLTTKNVILSANKDVNVFNGNMTFPDELFKQWGIENPLLNMSPFGNDFYIKPNSEAAPKIGLEVEDRADGEGVLVLDITKDSPAAKAGIEQNDVITFFNSKEISSVDDLIKALNEAKNKEKVIVEIKRKGMKKQITMEIPKTLKRKQL